MFSILIHADLYQSLCGSTRDVRSRVRKTLLRLRDGHWGGGTRVKRLQGVKRPVFEARTDRGDRLVFTAIRSADPQDPDRLSTHLQVWDLVTHDAVDRIKRRNRSAEAEFLEFGVEEQFDIEEPPPAPEATLDALPSEDGCDSLLHFLLPPDNFASRADEGITGAVRWFRTSTAMLADDDEFQRLLDRGGEGLELKLTRDQYNVLLAPGPALVAGSAGSGKTTIAVHRLADAASADPPLRALYLSYSPWLVDHARNLYQDVVAARGVNAAESPHHFATITDFYLRLIPPELRQTLANLIGPAAFRSWFVRSGLRLDPALVWEEIRSIVKGASLNLGKSMLNESEYFDLGRKRAPLFVDDRPEIYSIALRYQQWLSDQQCTDQIDVCRQAFRQLRHGKIKPYDVVICDEVQDLTEVEVAFVLSLSSDPALTRLMLSGDAQQIVNPSGFRWSEVRQAILKSSRGAKAPPLLRLRRNFRSVRPVVELANSVLALRRDIYGRTDEDDPEEATLEGAAPIQVLDVESRVVDAIRNFGPRCAVLVFSERDRDELQRALDTTRIFHIQEAKGLEFDTVVLWKVLAADPELVDRFLRVDRRLERDARFRQFLQHLYVAVTRARRHVAVFEGAAPHAFWNNGRFLNRLDKESAGALARLFRESASPADWVKEAEYYIERQRYRQAAECYRRAGRNEKELEAFALYAESVEDWMGALARWERLANLEHQAPLLERLGRIEEAMAVYLRLGQVQHAETLEIRLLERQQRWAEAGQRWESIGRTDEAMICYRKSGNRARALSFEAARAENEKNWARAAECWVEIQSWEAAGRCYRKAKDRQGAALADARQSESKSNWSAACSAYRRAGDGRKADECRARAYEELGKLAAAAKILERLNETDHALRLYRKIGDLKAIERLELSRFNLTEDQVGRVLSLEKKDKLQFAIKVAAARRAVLRSVLGKQLSYAKRRQFAGEWRELQIVESRCRATLAEREGAWGKALHHWRRAQDYKRADQVESLAAQQIPDPRKRAMTWMRLGKWDLAIDSFSEAGDSIGVQTATAYRLERDHQWSAAAEIWHTLNRPSEEANCLAQIQGRLHPQFQANRPAVTDDHAQGASFEEEDFF